MLFIHFTIDLSATWLQKQIAEERITFPVANAGQEIESFIAERCLTNLALAESVQELPSCEPKFISLECN